MPSEINIVLSIWLISKQYDICNEQSYDGKLSEHPE